MLIRLIFHTLSAKMDYIDWIFYVISLFWDKDKFVQEFTLKRPTLSSIFTVESKGENISSHSNVLYFLSLFIHFFIF